MIKQGRPVVENLINLAKAIKQKNIADNDIALITGRPAERGHTGEYIAASIFNIKLQESASHKGSDGYFMSNNFVGKTVNIKWYGKQEGILDLNLKDLPNYYLVFTGPKAEAISSRGATRPWLISHVYLFDAESLISVLSKRRVSVGVATSLLSKLWEAAEIYPNSNNPIFILSTEQRYILALFG